MKKKKFNKTQSIDDFLASGGKITIVPSHGEAKRDVVKSQAGGPAIILSLDEGDTYYGDKDTEEDVQAMKERLAKEIKEQRELFYNLPKVLRDKEVTLLKQKMQAGELDEAFKEDLEKYS